MSFATDTNTVPMTLTVSDYNLATGAALKTLLAGNTFTILSRNDTWTLSVRAQTSQFSFLPNLGDANPGKSSADLEVQESGSASWLPLTTGSQVFATGPKQNATVQRMVDYRFTSNLGTDPPGTYSLVVLWTLTQP